jgi:hypothetical protein
MAGQGILIESIYPREIADCECRYWAWAPEMGSYREDGHHPTCNAGHDWKTCGCWRCAFDGLRQYGTKPDKV